MLPFNVAKKSAFEKSRLQALDVAATNSIFRLQDAMARMGVVMTSMQERVNSMYARDRLWALAFIVALWVAVGAVFLGIQHLANGGVALALSISAFLIVGYNTASLLAMIKHYGEDKNWIYEIDIRHLDSAK